MSSYTKNNLKLISQGITGGKIWHLTDTGVIADVADVAGYITNAGDMGVDSGDLILVTANNGSGASGDRRVHAVAFGPVQDTGATQGTLGPATVIGDTG